MSNDIAIKAIRQIRKREDELFSQTVFCREHNFTLEAEKFKFAEDELKRVCRILEKAFDTGYISPHD